MFLISKLSKQYPVRCSLFQFQSFYTNSKRMSTSNEQIRHQLCQIDDLQNGQMKEFEIKTSSVNTSVLLVKQDNKFHAYSSKCCHYKLPLAKGVKYFLFFIF